MPPKPFTYYRMAGPNMNTMQMLNQILEPAVIAQRDAQIKRDEKFVQWLERPMMEKINRTAECIKEIAQGLNFANEVAEDYGFKADEETGIITVEAYDMESNEGGIAWTKQFRLVEVKE